MKMKTHIFSQINQTDVYFRAILWKFKNFEFFEFFKFKFFKFNFEILWSLKRLASLIYWSNFIVLGLTVVSKRKVKVWWYVASKVSRHQKFSHKPQCKFAHFDTLLSVTQHSKRQILSHTGNSTQWSSNTCRYRGGLTVSISRCARLLTSGTGK